MLAMMVWVNGMFAQTESESQADTTFVEPEVEPQSQVQPTANLEDLKQLLLEFNSKALEEQQLEKPDYSKIYKPLFGRGFFRRHHIAQRIEISVLGGTDKPEDSDDLQDFKNDAQSGNGDDGNSVNMGLNVGYSLVLVPGTIEEDQLRLNRFGFAYSLGFIASMDRQDKYGTTCDLLVKLGLETGNEHAMGIGIDGLFGTGSASVTTCVPFTADYTYTEHGVDWCLKYGFQIWVRSNLLHANIKNVDVRLFARYVYSKDPTNDQDLDFNQDGVPSGYYVWNPESWQFGLTFCYEF